MRRTALESKEQVISRLVEARRKILEVAAALPPGKQDQVFLGTWSVKDLLAHLVGWDGANIEAVGAILAGRLPSFYDHYDRDWHSFNARLVREHMKELYADLLASVEESHRKLIETVAEIPADEFVRDRGLRAKGWKVTVESILRVEASDEQAHYRQIEQFSQSSGR